MCFTSHTLDATVRNYAQIEKACLAIITSMNKWHQYLYGKRDITVHTDHQPLETIFKKPLSKAPRRLQRMMLKPQQYQFTVTYKKGKGLHVADTLSCAALNDPTSTSIQQVEVFYYYPDLKDVLEIGRPVSFLSQQCINFLHRMHFIQ